MITRIVKLNIDPKQVDTFFQLFQSNKNRIVAFQGCQSVELLTDTSDSNTLFTLSKWENDEALQNYRKSDLFKQIWSQAKETFLGKAAAWSVEPKGA